ncbi:pyridoxal phosphate-dependent decarboxylase family protein [Streptomyces sp. NPDC048172]|uniref:pyridoxal phosphate-dependent decarboxylase family protein n=1 Tax=Streptomyces sp. NPDC048172 TaxID=3365505 RepID=UPI003717B5A0
MAEHLADLSVRGLDLVDPSALSQDAKALMTEECEKIAPFDEKKLEEILDLYIRTGIPVHSPGYMGRQFSGVVPLGGVVEFVSSVLNQPSSFYEAGQLPNVAERLMADELNRFIGWEPGRFAMVTTSGGSLANLTAMLAARNQKFPRFWPDGAAGLEGGARPAIAVSDDVHYSVSRAAGVMGIGEAQIVRLPLNGRRQISIEGARAALAAAERANLRVFCLVASAGTTSVGAFDPIGALADLARERDIWLHVDGAHGASLLVSDRFRHKLRGIEKADSLTWDAHKMTFVPAPCTLLFYRDREASGGAFRQRASYVFDEKPDIYTELDSGDRNFECTKRPMIMSLWVLWAMYGRALFAEKVEYLCALTQQAYHLLHAEPDFETVHRPEANILCFRYRPHGVAEEDVHALQVAIRNRVKLRGRFFISKVNVDGVAALRVVMMNHEITVDHFRMLLEEIRGVGRTLHGTHWNPRRNGGCS